jgi:hypothetical protein
VNTVMNLRISLNPGKILGSTQLTAFQEGLSSMSELVTSFSVH